MYLKNPKSRQALAKIDPEVPRYLIFLVLCYLTWHSQFPRVALSNRNIMQLTFLNLNILVTMF